MVVLSLILFLLVLVCLAGVIIPFKPFKGRKQALLASLLASAMSAVPVMMEVNSPEFQADLAAEADTAIVNAELELEKNNHKKAKAILDELSDAAKYKRPKQISKIRGQITLIELLPKFEKIINDASISNSQKITRLKALWKTIEKSEHVKRALSEDFETHVLALVKPLPASDTVANRNGYLFLSKITQYTQTPDPTYSERANEYVQKIIKAEGVRKGCSLPNYQFTSQVPRLLKNPSSFKASRVYLGAKDDNGNQAVYMDYYATNGFGGTIQQTAQGSVKLDGCKFTLLSASLN